MLIVMEEIPLHSQDLAGLWRLQSSFQQDKHEMGSFNNNFRFPRVTAWTAYLHGILPKNDSQPDLSEHPRPLNKSG